ncbi:MAG: NAD(P)-dependent oxidoreductase [Nitriliruptor sp.]
MGTVLVTGATGFVGGRIARRLAARGDDVVAVVRSPSDELDALDVEQRIVPLGDLEGLQQAGRRASAVVHAAATAGPDHATAHAVNVDGTQAVAGAALLAGQRLIHISTTSVYDLAATGDREVREDDPLVARDGEAPPTSSSGSAYATTKAAAEDVVTLAIRNGLVGTILRPPAVLGAGPTSTWGTRVPARIRDGQAPAIRPESTFGWVHVEDLVDAVVAALDADAEVVRGLTANVVGGHVTFGDYRDAVVAFLGQVPDTAPEPGPIWRGRYATVNLTATLDVRPSRSFDAAMAEIADSWQGGTPRG